jgi:hypothetical protein
MRKRRLWWVVVAFGALAVPWASVAQVAVPVISITAAKGSQVEAGRQIIFRVEGLG